MKIKGVFLVAILTAVLQAFVAATVCADNQYLYWTDSGTVHRANLDGTGSTVVVTGLGDLRDVAVDDTGGKIYWTDFGGDKIQRCNLDGSGKQTLVSSYASPYYMDLDLKNGKMYWTEKTGGFYDMIRRANLNGSSVETLYTFRTGGGGADGIALDIDQGWMYLTISTTNADLVARTNLNAVPPWTVLTRAGLLTADIALDISAGKMYWTEYYYNHNYDGTIKRANIDGTSVETLVSGLQTPFGIALDLTGQRVYWTDMETGKIQYAGLDGSGLTDLQIDGLVGPRGIIIAPIPEPSSISLFTVVVVALRRWPKLRS